MIGCQAEAPHLEFVGAPVAVCEEVASAVAEELDAAAHVTGTLDEHLRAVARAVARELRLWVFLSSVCDRSDREGREELTDRLEELGAQAFALLDAPPPEAQVGAPADSTPVPAFVSRVVDVEGLAHGFEDERTEVKKAKWSRLSNRALGEPKSQPKSQPA